MTDCHNGNTLNIRCKTSRFTKRTVVIECAKLLFCFLIAHLPLDILRHTMCKNVNNLSCYNFDTHDAILIFLAEM